MDSTGHNEERRHQDDEPRVFMQCTEQAHVPLNREEIVGNDDSSQQKGDLGQIPLPPVEGEERHQGNSQELDKEREEQPGTGQGG